MNSLRRSLGCRSRKIRYHGVKFASHRDIFFTESFVWIEDANEARTIKKQPEDGLLFYWICIESFILSCLPMKLVRCRFETLMSRLLRFNYGDYRMEANRSATIKLLPPTNMKSEESLSARAD